VNAYTTYIGGKVVSVTTDGFITDIKDLEAELLKLPTENKSSLQDTKS